MLAPVRQSQRYFHNHEQIPMGEVKGDWLNKAVSNNTIIIIIMVLFCVKQPSRVEPTVSSENESDELSIEVQIPVVEVGSLTPSSLVTTTPSQMVCLSLVCF